MAKVLVSDALAAEGVEILERADGLEVDVRPGLAPGELLDAIQDVEGLVIRSGTKVTADVIERAERLRVIGRAGIGVDNDKREVDLGVAQVTYEVACDHQRVDIVREIDLGWATLTYRAACR